MKIKKTAALCTLLLVALCSGCRQSEKTDEHLTVYLWDNNMIKDIVPYIKAQIPDQEIEYIVGNNNVDLYNYLEKHGDLPDIITTRRFSEKDARQLQPCLLDLGAYNIVSEYYPYALQYYTDSDDAVKWLPVCGIPETIIANKTLFDECGISLPQNYQEFADCCRKFHEMGIRPYAAELSRDWAAHSLIQGAAIDLFSGIDGIEWRNSIETSSENTVFDEKLWTQIFGEVNTFIKDTYLTQDDLTCDLPTARDSFTSGKAAMFRGTPTVMEDLQSRMTDELVRLPYFSQTSEESWIYTYPSFNVALNSELENNEEKLELALEVLDCMVSGQGQKLVADGDGMISYNADVESDLRGLRGIEQQAEKNAFYIRYASNTSFSASLLAVQGIISGEMDEGQACAAFEQEITHTKEQEPGVIKLQKSYDICTNASGGRDAASVILSTVRKELGAGLAFSSYYYYTSSLYAGECTLTDLNMMVAHNDGTALSLVSLSGEQLWHLIEQYLLKEGQQGHVTTRYELPVASGMKLYVAWEDDHFALKNMETEGKTVDAGKTYDILLTDECMILLQGLYPEMNLENTRKADLSEEWTSVAGKGQQPCEPEDYIEIAGSKR